MRTTMNCVGLSAALLAVFIVEPLLAGPSRSPYGAMHPTYASQRQRQQQTNSNCYRSYDYRRSVQSRPSCSYETSPQIEFKAGDRVVVSGNAAKLMSGSDVLGRITKGTALELTRTHGKWLGTSVELDGRRVSGWISTSEVSYADTQLQPNRKAKGSPKDANKSTKADQGASSGSRRQNRCNVRTYQSASWSSNSRPIPDNLSTFQWGWWDLKDRW